MDGVKLAVEGRARVGSDMRRRVLYFTMDAAA